MKKYLVAAALIVSFASPALADFYIMFDKTTKKCLVSKSAVTPSEQFSMMGQIWLRGRGHDRHVEDEGVQRLEAASRAPDTSPARRLFKHKRALAEAH
jgi:hypothetical protein